jgi:hypothetical protein
MMMKKVLVVMLILGLASAANAALTLKLSSDAPIAVNGTLTATVSSSIGGSYSCWLEIKTPAIANFAAAPTFTAAGNPNGDSKVTAWPEFGAWYEVLVASLNPDKALLAGDHIQATIKGLAVGQTELNLYADDAATLLSSKIINVPEPMTLALLGLGGLMLRRRS